MEDRTKTNASCGEDDPQDHAIAAIKTKTHASRGEDVIVLKHDIVTAHRWKDDSHGCKSRKHATVAGPPASSCEEFIHSTPLPLQEELCGFNCLLRLSSQYVDEEMKDLRKGGVKCKARVRRPPQRFDEDPRFVWNGPPVRPCETTGALAVQSTSLHRQGARNGRERMRKTRDANKCPEMKDLRKGGVKCKARVKRPPQRFDEDPRFAWNGPPMKGLRKGGVKCKARVRRPPQRYDDDPSFQWNGPVCTSPLSKGRGRTKSYSPKIGGGRGVASNSPAFPLLPPAVGGARVMNTGSSGGGSGGAVGGARVLNSATSGGGSNGAVGGARVVTGSSGGGSGGADGGGGAPAMQQGIGGHEGFDIPASCTALVQSGARMPDMRVSTEL
ncbi:hypothetical protein Bbelb_235780 [Branchiostoma belcheri]|nr:hypothetical protein Bbelb_235780 [Branchiostoma belcheri]